MNQTFVINNITLEIPEKVLTPSLLAAFSSGKYEHLEARQVPRFMRDGDRLLEIGAGVGFISCLASRLWKLENCTVVEGNPDLIPIIENNYKLNNVSADIMNCIALSREGKINLGVKNDVVNFYQKTNFWGSSLSPSGGYVSSVEVPVKNFQSIVDKCRPTVIICDIEGGEYDLFSRIDLSGVRALLLETHKSVIGMDGIDKMANDLRKEGFYYDPDYSVGAVVVYSRIEGKD